MALHCRDARYMDFPHLLKDFLVYFTEQPVHAILKIEGHDANIPNVI